MESPVIVRAATRRGRALLACPDGAMYCSRHWDIFRSDDDGATWRRVLTIRRPAKRRAAELSRLACRLLRHEVRAFAVLPDGGSVASTRTGVFWAAPGQATMMPARIDADGPAPQPPMRMTVDGTGRVLWGEYFGNPQRQAVRLFISADSGRTYQVGRVFEPGDIRHIHNILYDRGADKLWVFSGDHDREPGLAVLSMDLRDLTWVARGRQQYRLVEAFDLGDRLVYGTDTEKEGNAIFRFDKASGKLSHLADLDGSCLHACRCGPWMVLSTTAEVAAVNRQGVSSLWASRDGEAWRPVFQARKDRWPHKFFQYGSLVLPRGHSRRVLMFSGQAVRKWDGKLICANPEEFGLSAEHEAAGSG